MVIDNISSNINYFLSGPKQEDFKDVFKGIGCFKGTFALQTKPDIKQYQAPPSCVAYALQTRVAIGAGHHHTTRHG